MAHVDGLRGRCTPGDAAVVDALRKLLSGEFSKAEAHDVWTTAVADITTAPHARAQSSPNKRRKGRRGEVRSKGHQGDPLIDGLGSGGSFEVFRSLKWQPMVPLEGADPLPESFPEARMWLLSGLLRTHNLGCRTKELRRSTCTSTPTTTPTPPPPPPPPPPPTQHYTRELTYHSPAHPNDPPSTGCTR